MFNLMLLEQAVLAQLVSNKQKNEQIARFLLVLITKHIFIRKLFYSAEYAFASANNSNISSISTALYLNSIL